MKLYCDNYFSKEHDKINLSKDISCCLGLLLEKYDESELYSLQKSYAGFLVRTINHYLKKTDYNMSEELLFFQKESEINIILLSKLINIITHYSVILILHNKNTYTKLISSIGIDLINFSKFKYDKNLIKKKIFLFNNLSCLYLSEKRYYKSKIFLDKCIEINKTSLDNIITYNNISIIYIKKIKENYKKYKYVEIKKIVNEIIYYLHLEFKELRKRLINKYRDELKQNKENNESNKSKNETQYLKIMNKESYSEKKELTCFLFYICFYIMKFFDKNEFNKNINNGIKIIQKLLGKMHHISIKMIRLNDKNNISMEDIIKNDNKIINDNESSFEKI